MTRAFLIVLDSVGCGGAPDAADFGDEGSDTLGHIFQRRGQLDLPNLGALGLGKAMEFSTGVNPPWKHTRGEWAVATEISKGKDTPSGHWELAGVPVPWDWHFFPNQIPAFPPEVLNLVAEFAGGSLGNTHASGTQVIEDFASEHVKTGLPICYTSADSVFQIAAHEKHFGLERLYDMCRFLAPALHAMKVGRVIARPFLGEGNGNWTRTVNRKDFAILPPSPTICDDVSNAGGQVRAIGKIGDIFSMQGIKQCRKGNDATLMTFLEDEFQNAPAGSFVFANFVEFDSEFGHRRDVEGYARHLEWFDDCIGKVLQFKRAKDLVIFTADHGNDPTWHGTDHTRERVPVLIDRGQVGSLGGILFSDVADIIRRHLNVPKSDRAALI